MRVLGEILLSFFFIGKVRYLPGTSASFVTCLLIFFFGGKFKALEILVLFFLIASSIFFLKRLRLGSEDPRWVVIDEVLGMYVTMIGRSSDPLNILVGFMTFRFFDIMKPYPVGILERIKGEWGILADDIASGLIANFILYLFQPVLESVKWS